MKTVTSLMHAAPQPMIVLWGDDLLCLTNPPARALLDMPAGVEPIEKSWPDGWRRLQDDVRAVLGTEAAVHHPEWTLGPPGDGDRRVSLTCSRIFDNAGPGGVLLTVADPPAAPRLDNLANVAQAALIASEERLRLGLAAGRMVTWEFDLTTGHLSQSSNAEALFGPGSRVSDFAERMPAEDLARDQARLQRALASPDGLYTSEFRYHHPDGGVMHLQNWGQVMRDATGAPVRVHGVCMDITERKQAETALVQQVEQRTEELQQAEEALRQAQKMEALGHLTGGVAHDFNNLLAAMVGNFELIRLKHDDKARVQSLAESGLLVAERGAKLTSQLLTFSRAQRVDLVPVDIGAVLDGMRDMLRRTLGPLVTITFATNCGDRRVRSDPTQLEMAILNLAINARDAMPLGGKLIIAADVCAIAQHATVEPGDYIELRVTDTGTGMSSVVAARAFDPFFTTKGIGKGTGLGLSQVHGLVRQAGGEVQIDSRVGHGCTVRLLLPCTDAQAQHEPETPLSSVPAPSAARTRPATILLVEDDQDLRAVLAASLQDLGYDVLEAGDGAEALELLERHAPDLLVTDMAMPEMTGADLALIARARRPALPIIFVTGFAETPDFEFPPGPLPRVLRKPFRLKELQSEIEAALQA